MHLISSMRKAWILVGDSIEPSRTGSFSDPRTWAVSIECAGFVYDAKIGVLDPVNSDSDQMVLPLGMSICLCLEVLTVPVAQGRQQAHRETRFTIPY